MRSAPQAVNQKGGLFRMTITARQPILEREMKMIKLAFTLIGLCGLLGFLLYKYLRWLESLGSGL